MSYNDSRNNDNNMKYDDMNIKKHLNTSLDLDGISVSEELFQRTLAAIKEQQVQREEHGASEGEDKFGRKIVAWNRYVRSIAGVAAALILVVVGYNVVKQMPVVKNETTSMDGAAPEANLAMDQSASEEARTQMMAEAPAAANATTNAAAEDAKQAESGENSEYTISADQIADEGYGVSAKLDKSDAGTVQEGIEGETMITKIPDDDLKTHEFSTTLRGADASAITHTFRDILLLTPEEAEYITVSNNISNYSITLTALEDIQAFYLIMDTHQFTDDGQEEAGGQDYTVEMKNTNTQVLYTMYLGSKLLVKCIQGDNVTENVYDPDDETLLKQDIEAFLQEYSE
jgi:hypothetical protein